MAYINDPRKWAKQQLAPFTIGVCMALVLSSLTFWVSQGQGLEWLAFSRLWLGKPWSILTYPFSYVGVGGISELLWFLLLLGWLLMAGGSIERQIGTQRYALFWVAMTVLPALCLWLGMMALGMSGAVTGPYLPVAGISVAWATRNRTAPVSLMGIVPLTGMWIGVIVVAGTFFMYGSRNPAIGFFSIIHLALAYAFADNKIPGFGFTTITNRAYRPSKQAQIKEDTYFDDVVRREKEREERERLRRLFEGSLNDKDDR